jgi:hypothetical protein
VHGRVGQPPFQLGVLGDQVSDQIRDPLEHFVSSSVPCLPLPK